MIAKHGKEISDFDLSTTFIGIIQTFGSLRRGIERASEFSVFDRNPKDRTWTWKLNAANGLCWFQREASEITTDVENLSCVLNLVGLENTVEMMPCTLCAEEEETTLPSLTLTAPSDTESFLKLRKAFVLCAGSMLEKVVADKVASLLVDLLEKGQTNGQITFPWLSPEEKMEALSIGLDVIKEKCLKKSVERVSGPIIR